MEASHTNTNKVWKFTQLSFHFPYYTTGSVRLLILVLAHLKWGSILLCTDCVFSHVSRSPYIFLRIPGPGVFIEPSEGETDSLKDFDSCVKAKIDQWNSRDMTCSSLIRNLQYKYQTFPQLSKIKPCGYLRWVFFFFCGLLWRSANHRHIKMKSWASPSSAMIPSLVSNGGYMEGMQKKERWELASSKKLFLIHALFVGCMTRINFSLKTSNI